MRHLHGPLAITISLLASLPGHAGGPRAVNGLGQPMKWASGGPIVYNPDPGPLGHLGNSEARALLASAFAEWASVGVVSFSEGSALPADVNGAGVPATNPAHFKHLWRIEGDGRSPVIFDNDGSVIDGLFGAGARFDILGIGALDTPLGHCAGGGNAGARCTTDGECGVGATCSPSATITEASMVINGLFFDGVGLPDSPPDLDSLQALEAVMVHEIGHFLNLDHSVVNHELAGDGNRANDIYLPTMYPIASENEAALATLNPDDVAALRGLYDSGAVATEISGLVTESDGTPFQGAQIVVRKTDDPLMTAYSVSSGERFFPFNAGSTGDPGSPPARGAYSVKFIQPGSYTACVRQIDTRFSPSSGTFVGPLATPPILRGPEECYDGAESGLVSDDPDDAATVVAGVLTGVNIRLDALPGAGNDGFEPNNTPATASTLADLAGGQDTAPAHLGTGDLDYYAFPVTTGQHVHIDIDAAELGSSLDAVIGVYSSTNTLLAFADDAVDPDSGAYAVDPALDFVAGASEMVKLVVSSYPDLDLNGGGASTGGYWIRVRYDGDLDGDGVGDGADNCSATSNAAQDDFDGDGIGDACDDDDDNDGLLDSVETDTGVFVSAGNTGTSSRNADSDGDGIGDGAEVSGGTDPNVLGSTPGLFSTAHEVSSTPAAARSVIAADVDGDGDLDLLSGSGEIAWYANLDGAGTFGPKHVVDVTGSTLTIRAGDLDGDGDVDIVSATPGVGVAWYENTDGAGSFVLAQVIATHAVATWAPRVTVADLDRDGDLDVVSVSTDDDKVAWYENTDGAGSFGSQVVISTASDGVYGVFAADLDQDGEVDVISCSDSDNEVAWYQNSNGVFGGQRMIDVAPSNCTAVTAADLDGDGDLDVIATLYTAGTIAWYENLDGAGTFGPRRVLSAAAGTGLNDVFAADLDGDGDIDVASASIDFSQLNWYENTLGDGSSWSRQQIANPDGAFAVFVADLDHDGEEDVLAASEVDNKISWYKNRSIHRSAVISSQTVISSAASSPTSVFAADMDGDGDMDPLSASFSDDKIAWYENDGAAPPGFTPHSITTLAAGARSVFAADVDRDGDMDALSASYSDQTVAWYRNDGGSPPSFTRLQIDASADGAWSVFAADVDADGDVDALSANNNSSGNMVVWYENDGGSPPAWTPRTISDDALGASSVFAGDVDGDGDIDVLSAAFLAETIEWYENDGASPPAWTPHTIRTGAGGANSVFAADVDGDGDMDVLSASVNDNEIAWYESNGAPLPGWTPHTISAVANGAESVFGKDVDGDGDIDVFSASYFDGKVAWYENDGASPPGWTAHTISTAAAQATSVFAADLNGDGDVDALSASFLGNKVAWYEARGGQFAFDTTALAPGAAADGASVALLRIDMTHLGRPGDAPIALSALRLNLEESAGDPLSAVEANALIQNLHVYLDDGSGTFEAGADERITTVATLAGGIETVAFASTSDPRLLVAHGSTKSLFIVAELTSNASSRSPNRFRLTHLAAASSARDAASGRALAGASAPDVSSPVMTAIAPDATPPSVTGVFPGNGAIDVSPSTTVVVSMTEPVDPSTVTPLTVSLSVSGIKVVGKLALSSDGRLVTFDPSGILALNTAYTIEVASGLRDRAGNGAVPFSATFDTAHAPGSGDIAPVQVGNPDDDDVAGAALGGADASEHFGFSVAAVGDVNQDGIADLVVGSPAANLGALVDAGKATLVFGGSGLQSNASAALKLGFLGPGAHDLAGSTVARAGDIDHDGIADFAVGAPGSDLGGADSGAVYIVFGDALLAGQAPGPIGLDTLAATSTGIVIVGDAAGDLAGTSVAYAGDVDGDGNDDLLIGAPGASPGGRQGAGRVYLLFGPLSAGTIDLSTVGCPAAPHRGIIFQGENTGDRAGESVSWWEDATGFDDLLIGAPGAAVLDEYGATVLEAGYVYAIHGGPANLGTCGPIELSRVADGLPDQIGGVLYLGAIAHGRIGRSVTGAADVDGDGVADVIIGGNNEVWLIPGGGPKGRSGSSTLSDQTVDPTPVLVRQLGANLATDEYAATRFIAGQDGVLGDLTVGPGGDINNDGIDDFVIGAPGADIGANADAGKVYVVYGRPGPFGSEVLLSDVGSTVSGFTVRGAEAGDRLGNTVGGGFDVNGDGVDDALAGAPLADAMQSIQSDAGQAFVLSPVSPDEVGPLSLSRSGGVMTLGWNPSPRALVYNVYRGLLTVLRTAGHVKTSDMAQLACAIPTTATTDGANPASGAGFFYLVTGENLSGEGPLGPQGVAPPRVLDAQCP